MLVLFNDLIVETGGDYSAKASIVINRQLFGRGSKIPKKTKINGKSMSELSGESIDVDLVGGVYLVNIQGDQLKISFV
jgi:hypothetical protein